MLSWTTTRLTAFALLFRVYLMAQAGNPKRTPEPSGLQAQLFVGFTSGKWAAGHPIWGAVFLIVVIYLLWAFLLRFIILRFAPLKVLAWNEGLIQGADQIEVEVPVSGSKLKFPFKSVLRSVSLLARYRFHSLVLDAWIDERVSAARVAFERLPMVASRKILVALPVVVNGKLRPALEAQDLHSVALRERWCVLVRGEGGLGKTTLALQLAAWAMADEPAKRLCRDRKMLPILVEPDVRFDIRSDLSTFIRELRGNLQKLIGAKQPISEVLFEQLLRDRRLVVILDGLSEMIRTSSGPSTARPEHPEFPVNALIVTSREDENLNPELTIEPRRIDNTHLLGFINSYLTDARQTELTDSELFEASRRLANLVTMETGITPLLARLFAEQLVDLKSHREHIQKLPQSVPDLMLSYLNSLNRNRKLDDPDDPSLHRAAKIAAWECMSATLRPGQPASKERIRGLLVQGQLEDRLLDRLEVLRIVKTDEPAKTHVRFELDPLSEYLAALKLVEDCAEGAQCWHSFFEAADSKEGSPKTIRGFLLAVRDCCEARVGNYRTPEFVGVELANRLALDSDALAVARHRRRVEQLIQHLRSSEPVDRKHAAQELRKIGRAAHPALIEACKDPELNVRTTAIETLAKIGASTEPIVLALLEALNDSEQIVRSSAAASLGDLEPAAEFVVSALTKTLEVDPDAGVRASCADALRKLGPAAGRAVPALVTALMKDSDPNVRRISADALARIGAAAVPGLIKALGNRKSHLRTSAAETLAKIGQAAIPHLIAGLSDSNSWVRRSAAHSLGRMGPTAKPAVPALIEGLRDPRPHVRESVVDALSRIGAAALPALIATITNAGPDIPESIDNVLERIGTVAVPALIEVLRNPEPAASRAADVLKRIGDIAAPALINALGESNPKVRISAADILREIGRAAQGAVPHLIKLLKEPGVGERRSAARALEGIGRAMYAAVPALRLATNTASVGPSLRRSAASALSTRGLAAQGAVVSLTKALNDNDSIVRSSVANALAEMVRAAQATVTALTQVFEDSDAEVRSTAAYGLRMIMPTLEAAVPALTGALTDTDPEVRSSAAYGLGEVGPSACAAVSAVIRALRDTDPRVRSSATYCLWKIGRDAVPALVDALKDSDAEVRNSAVFALGAIGPGAEAAVSVLIEILKDPTCDICGAAEEALWKIGPGAVPSLIDALSSSERSVRRSVTRALWKIGPSAVRDLIEVLGNPEREMRCCAIEALWNIGEPAVAPLIDALKHAEQSVRIGVADALGEMGSVAHGAVAALTEALNDSDSVVRYSAARALGCMGSTAQTAIPALCKLLVEDVDSGVRSAASRTLGEIGPAAMMAVAALTEALKDSDVDVRNSAMDVLKTLRSFPAID
ncbi:MAG: hypothetical protein C5B51_22015 [Terriglobia bacterium]|nr:MAG: hypothetical protein C5B51_22015 [Terriglobia bacterium]